MKLCMYPKKTVRVHTHSTDEGQREDSSNQIDGSEIDVKLMGQFDMGEGK